MSKHDARGQLYEAVKYIPRPDSGRPGRALIQPNHERHSDYIFAIEEEAWEELPHFHTSEVASAEVFDKLRASDSRAFQRLLRYLAGTTIDRKELVCDAVEELLIETGGQRT